MNTTQTEVDELHSQALTVVLLQIYANPITECVDLFPFMRYYMDIEFEKVKKQTQIFLLNGGEHVY